MYLRCLKGPDQDSSGIRTVILSPIIMWFEVPLISGWLKWKYIPLCLSFLITFEFISASARRVSVPSSNILSDWPYTNIILQLCICVFYAAKHFLPPHPREKYFILYTLYKCSCFCNYFHLRVMVYAKLPTVLYKEGQ